MDQHTPIAPEWPLHIEGAALEAFRDDCHRRAAELREQAMDEAFAAAGASWRKGWAKAALSFHAALARNAGAKVHGA